MELLENERGKGHPSEDEVHEENKKEEEKNLFELKEEKGDDKGKE